MASRYAKTIKVPDGFPDTLRNFAREVLRQQEKLATREDILQYGIKYFKDLAEKRAGINNGPTFATEKFMTMADEEIDDFLWQTFRAADPPSAGHIDIADFKKAFSDMVDYLKLNPLARLRCAAEVDELENASVAYSDFVAAASRVISTLKKRKSIESPLYDANAGKEVPINEDTDALLHGLLREEMESLLREILHHVDVENAGSVTRHAFLGCLQDGDLGLTRREINLILFQVPETVDNIVIYSDIIPTIFDVLLYAHANDLLETPRSEDVVEVQLNKVFASGDDDGTGLLSFAALKTTLRLAGVGLSRIQIIALLSEAVEEEEDAVNYEAFAKRIAPMVLRMIDFDTQSQLASVARVYRSSEEYFVVHGMNQHEFSNALTTAFEAIDDGERGCLSRRDIAEAVQNAFPSIARTHLSALLALSDPIPGSIEMEYAPIVHNGFQALQWLHEYVALSAHIV
ncbi:hypothetical protein SDRG_00402 [Saprolegnia diclina VS20]|uniref:EF-hand domain-containing protein n=1 Tax=Saprolegnia diclina (strain VS20) TaxID=1156394 RepID=T0QWR3_SAPDV|nr:hypothetical protein SDRG_00402 [Saprolegnia diclina VS20]EQC42674.1 hypothetical protein SDRG_00402 [Saprolegnia diclina VS20]|eukprot:XP_008604097.1 hypothetical protein SDRG_00402 [Saprolegnia diclina VS20]